MPRRVKLVGCHSWVTPYGWPRLPRRIRKIVEVNKPAAALLIDADSSKSHHQRGLQNFIRTCMRDGDVNRPARCMRPSAAGAGNLGVMLRTSISRADHQGKSQVVTQVIKLGDKRMVDEVKSTMFACEFLKGKISPIHDSFLCVHPYQSIQMAHTTYVTVADGIGSIICIEMQ